jgi:hypothetical protein
VVENISLTYAKFSCSLFMIDSCFSHEMTPCIILGSPNVCIFLSNLLLLDSPNMREVFDEMVKLTRCYLTLEPKNSDIFSRLQHHKNQAANLLDFALYMYIFCLCTKICLVLHGASKIFTLSFMVQVKQLDAAS